VPQKTSHKVKGNIKRSQVNENTWAVALRKAHKSTTSAPAQMDYAVESPFPCWPREPLASAHINNLMIIAKEKNHTQNNQTSKG